MNSELVARIYERLWRPTFVRMLAGKGAGAALGGVSGELFIHKHSLDLDDRPGPWLDLSCGPGAFVRALAAASPGHLVVGLDISRAMLDVAAQRTSGYTNVVLVRGDAHALPFIDGSFGGVNNAGALHAYDDPELVFRENPARAPAGRALRRLDVRGGAHAARPAHRARRRDPPLRSRRAARLASAHRLQPTSRKCASALRSCFASGGRDRKHSERAADDRATPSPAAVRAAATAERPRSRRAPSARSSCARGQPPARRRARARHAAETSLPSS